MSDVGKGNATILALIAERRITRAELNRRIKAGEFPDIHRELIADALREAGL